MSGHHAAAIDPDGRQLWRGKIADDRRQVEDLVARTGRSGAEARRAAGMVSPMTSLLLAILVTSGQDVVHLPGAMAAGVLGGEGKTAAKDAGSSPASPAAPGPGFDHR
jgi:Transposase